MMMMIMMMILRAELSVSYNKIADTAWKKKKKNEKRR